MTPEPLEDIDHQPAQPVICVHLYSVKTGFKAGSKGTSHLGVLCTFCQQTFESGVKYVQCFFYNFGNSGRPVLQNFQEQLVK